MCIMKEKIITKVAEITETDLNLVTEKTNLSTLDAWDSLANVLFIAYAISDFGVKLTGEEMMESETVADLIKLIENKKQS